MTFAASAWTLVKDTVTGFIDDNALSRGASIAYYTLFSIAPVLLIIVAIAGLEFGRDAAQGAIVGQLSGLMGERAAKALEEMIKSADDRESGIVATAVGIVALIATATGVFGEVQSAMNAIWKAKPRSSTLTRLVRARMASLGLVVTCGFLLTVSLAVSAGLKALSEYLNDLFPGADVILQVFDFIASTAIISGLFAAIYKVLPDKPITWRDVAIGAVATTLLFEGGKYLIALYVGRSNVASSYGAAGALIVLLLWIYYTAQIFLLGAEFTHAFATRHGSHAGGPEKDGGAAFRNRHGNQGPMARVQIPIQQAKENPMEQTIVAQFDTRRNAETAVEHLVQEHGINRSDVFVRAAGTANSAGVRPAGGDVESGHPGVEKRGTPELSGPIEVSIDCHGDKATVVRSALEKAGALRLSTK